jgi:hypothetical protein
MIILAVEVVIWLIILALKWTNFQTKVDNNSHIYNTSKHDTIAYSWMLRDFVQELFNLHLQGEHFHL